MKLVLQRVAHSSVCVDGDEIARIGKGLMILFGAEKNDREESITWLAEKSLNLRIFPDENGKMNLSVQDIGGELLVVSQFTLAGDCSRGRRPGFDRAAQPEEAERLYRLFVEAVGATGLKVGEGRFGADMKVELLNDGPVTLILEK